MIPMNSPGWFDDLPEYVTEAEYRELSEQISRIIEIVHGHVITCESPVPRHNRMRNEGLPYGGATVRSGWGRTVAPPV
jgi:hypothetical protein